MADDETHHALSFRPAYVDANIEPVDRLGRKQFRRLGLPAFMSTFAMMPVEAIPGEFWTMDVNGEGFTIAVVSCPCGEVVEIEAGGPIQPCEVFPIPGSLKETMPEDWTPERCPRAYLFSGSDVFVVNSPKGREAQTAAAS